MSKVQRWLHELALPKIDPETHLYISHTSESASYRSLWNYDYAAAPIPILFFSGLTSHTWWTEWVNREMAKKYLIQELIWGQQTFGLLINLNRME